MSLDGYSSAGTARPLIFHAVTDHRPKSAPAANNDNLTSSDGFDFVENKKIQTQLAEIVEISRQIAGAIKVVEKGGGSQRFGYDLSTNQLKRLKNLQNPYNSTSPSHEVVTGFDPGKGDAVLELRTREQNYINKLDPLPSDESTEQVRIYRGETPSFKIIRRHSHPSGEQGKKECLRISSPKIPFTDQENIPVPEEISWETPVQDAETKKDSLNDEFKYYTVPGDKADLQVLSFEGQSFEEIVERFHRRVMTIYNQVKDLIETAGVA